MAESSRFPHFLLRALPALLFLAALASGCAGRDRRVQEEKARLEAQRQSAFQQLGGLQPDERGPAEIPGLSTSPPDQVAPRPRPEWAGDGLPAAYPSALYLTGVGSAERGDRNAYKALATAEERARAELAKSIRVRIQAQFDNAARLVTESSSGTTAILQDRNETADRIRSQADVELEGVHIVDRWCDRQSGAYWALAALERANAGQRILDRMELVRRQSEVDRDLGQGFAQAGQRVQAAASFQRAAQAVYTALNLRAQLNVIAPGLLRAQPPEPLPVAALLKEATGALERLNVKMAVFANAEGATVTAEGAEALLAAALRKEGLNLARLNAPPAAKYDELAALPAAALREWAGEDTDILVLARLSARQVAEEPMAKLTMHFYQARGNAVALDLRAERLLTSASFDLLPGSHSANADPQRAAEAALHQAAAELSARLRAGFIEAFALTKE